MFDWADYLTLAQELATRRSDEAALRPAVSRAYYAAFCQARNVLRREGVNTGDLRSHTALCMDQVPSSFRSILSSDWQPRRLHTQK